MDMDKEVKHQTAVPVTAAPGLPADLLSLPQAEFDALYEKVVPANHTAALPFWSSVLQYPSCCSCATISGFYKNYKDYDLTDAFIMDLAKQLRAKLANVGGWSLNMATACTRDNPQRGYLAPEDILQRLGFREAGFAQSCHGGYNVRVWIWTRPRRDKQ